MKISSISIKNLNSLRLEKTIDFEISPFKEVGLFAIVGDTGAGKTTILDAITLALYGKVHRNKDAKEVMSYGTAECYAEVIFDVKGERYLAQWTIWRSRGKADGNLLGPNRKLSKWDEEKQVFTGIAEKIREVDEKVEAITGLDYHRFTRSVLLSQGDFAAFLKADEKERSDLLERITGTEVYSTISKAAFTRHKLEQEQLKSLNVKLDNLHLFDQETLKEKKAVLKEKEIVAKAQKKELDDKRIAILWWEKWAALEQKLAIAEEELVTLKEAEINFAPTIARLLAHQEALPLQTHLIQLADTQKALKILKEEIPQYTQIRDKLLMQQRTVADNCQMVEMTYQEAKITEKEQLPLIDKVIQLDIALVEKEIPIQAREKDLNLSLEKATRTTGRIEELRQELDNHQEELAALTQWLKKNKSLQDLPQAFQAIRDLFYSAGKIFNEKKVLAQKLRTASASMASLSKTAEQLDTAVQNKQQELEDLEIKFKAKLPDNYALGRSTLIGNLNQEIEQMAEIWQQIEHWKRHQEDYQALMREFSDYQEQLSNLEYQAGILDSQVMSAWEVRDAAHRQLEYKQAIWEQQKAIASFEQHRAGLKEGEECPLCLSKAHPFRTLDFEPYVDEAKKEQKAAKTAFEAKEKSFRKLMNEQQTLNLKISELRGNEIEQTQGRLAKQTLKVKEIEEQFAKLIPRLGAYDFWNLKLEEVKYRIANFAENLKKKRELRNELASLNHQLEVVEKAYLTAKEKTQTHANLLLQVKADVTFIQSNIESHTQNYEDTSEKLSVVLEKFGLQFLPEKGNAIFSELASKKELVIEKNEQKSVLEKQLEVLQKELELEEKRLQDLTDGNRDLAEKLNIEKEQLATLKEQRVSLYGDKQPQDERKRLSQKREHLADKLKTVKETLEQLNLELKKTETYIEEKRSQLVKLEATAEDIHQQLTLQLDNTQFEDIDAARDAILDAETVTTITKRQEELTIQMSSTKKEIEKIAKEIMAKNAEKDGKELLSDLQNTFPVIEASFQILQQDIGRLKGQLEEHKKRKVAAKELLQTIGKQRLECNRWAALNDLVGSADGKKFRVFAQGLTLRNLVILANQHLQNLNGRYLILKPDDQDLRLDILDTFQADNIRSMNTLSGGESFLVSLALALGLSDLAGRNTNIRSLFIDEGFGTLDENSLDIALTTLENLQASGKTIGVISHVKALKERITTQIIMQKKGTGFSEMEILA